MRMKARPGVVSHILCCILCCLLVVTLIAAVMLGALALVTGQKAMHMNTAIADSTIAAQMTMIENKITELADIYHFDKTPVLALVTEEAIRQQNVDTVSWWTGLFSAVPSYKAPSFKADTVYDIVLADEGFVEAAGTHAYASARQVVKGVRNAVNQTILPIRSELITLGLKQAGKKLDITRFTALIPWLPALCFGMALMICALILLLCGRLICKGRMYIGCGLGASGVLLLVMLIGLLVVDLPGLFGRYSSMMAMQLAKLTPLVIGGLALCIVVFFAAAFFLIRSHQKKMVLVRRANLEEVPA